jgi:hypothetical protein
VEHQARQLDMDVLQSVDEADAVLGQDCSRLSGRLAGNEQRRGIRIELGVVNELVRCGGVRPALDLDDDRLLSVRVAKDRVGAMITNSWLGRYG